MRDSGFELRRILLPRIRVNKGKDHSFGDTLAPFRRYATLVASLFGRRPALERRDSDPRDDTRDGVAKDPTQSRLDVRRLRACCQVPRTGRAGVLGAASPRGRDTHA